MNASVNKIFRWMMIAFATSALLAACGGDDNEAENQTLQDCGDGEEIVAEGETFCVYSQSITEEGFSCPPHVNVPAFYGDVTICSKSSAHPAELFDFIHEQFTELDFPEGPCRAVACSPDHICSDGTCELQDNSQDELQACLEACETGCMAPEYQICAEDGERYCSICQVECHGLDIADDPYLCGQFYELTHYRAPCTGEGTTMCLQGRSLAEDPEDSFDNFYDEIEGFTHVWGRTYLLELQVEEVLDPPADGSSLSYTLIDILDESPVETGTTFDLPFLTAEHLSLISVEDLEGTLDGDRAFRCEEATVCQELVDFLDADQPLQATFRYDDDIDDALILDAVIESEI